MSKISSRFVNFLPNLFLILIGISAAILNAELYLRINTEEVRLPPDCYQADEILNHSFIPKKTCLSKTAFWNVSYQINSLGLRDREYSLKNPEGTFRILVLGDSMTEGWGVEQEETYSDQLEELLAEKIPAKKIEVLNAGVASYSPVLEYLYLKEKGLQFEPDLVILAFDITDFLDEKEYARVTTSFDSGIPRAVKPYISSHIQVYLQNLKPEYEETSFTKHSSLAKLIFKPKPKPLDTSSLFFPDKESWELVKKNLLLIKKTLEKHQIKFLLLIYPWKTQLADQLYLEPLQKLAEFANQEEFQIFDVTKAFQEKKPSGLYIEGDLHFNKNGHRLIAEKLFEYLISQKLIER